VGIRTWNRSLTVLTIATVLAIALIGFSGRKDPKEQSLLCLFFFTHLACAEQSIGFGLAHYFGQFHC
jgi:hypothetical protein